MEPQGSDLQAVYSFQVGYRSVECQFLCPPVVGLNDPQSKGKSLLIAEGQKLTPRGPLQAEDGDARKQTQRESQRPSLAEVAKPALMPIADAGLVMPGHHLRDGGQFEDLQPRTMVPGAKDGHQFGPQPQANKGRGFQQFGQRVLEHHSASDGIHQAGGVHDDRTHPQGLSPTVQPVGPHYQG
jgi:hypothetical protein